MDMNANFIERTDDMKYSIEWFYALVSGKLIKPEKVYVKCPHCGNLCNAHNNGKRCSDCKCKRDDHGK